MNREGGYRRALLLALLSCALCAGASAQRAKRTRAPAPDAEFGPIVRAYLSYLRDQQEVVDDRVSRREVDRTYYLHNSNRIRALREMALRIARSNDNDFLPELEAVAESEFDQLFDDPLPQPALLREGETLGYKFRFLGAVAVRAEKFYLFARLDPYEQAELMQKAEAEKKKNAQAAPDAASRPRRVEGP
ncbi:MAG TPA: hypothetical protein VGX48_22520 [Pyrinomonadaceae bacterium]|jgi:hypothetical protein|nr:hypothetical protein [Pyrinomonadaceae bacterium]